MSAVLSKFPLWLSPKFFFLVFFAFSAIMLGLFEFGLVNWPTRSAIFPRMILATSVALCAMYVVYAVVRRIRPGTRPNEKVLDLGFETDLEQEEVNLKANEAILLLCVLVAATLLLGFHLSLPVFLFLYVRLVGRQKGLFSLIYSAMISGVLIFGLDLLIQVRWPTPLIMYILP